MNIHEKLNLFIFLSLQINFDIVLRKFGKEILNLQKIFCYD